MVGKNKYAIGIIVAVSIILIVLMAQGVIKIPIGKPLAVGLTSFTPVFCNDYEFTCCGEKATEPGSIKLLADQDNWQCPVTNTRCSITLSNTASNLKIYKGSKDCGIKTAFFNDYFTCSDAYPLGNTQNFDINPGEYIWSAYGTNAYVSFQKHVAFLGFCGKSGTFGKDVACGTAVSGADQCKFNPTNGVIYKETSALLGKTNVFSYTVPLYSCILAFQSGDRHICGYLEESCATDTECGGHTYGNKECIGRTLQTYGCRSFGTIITEKDRAPSDPGWSETDATQSSSNTFGKRCEIVSAQNVQCCGDTDCGTNFFCDKTTFTCKEQVQCRADTDCGVSTQCDYTTKSLKTPKCSFGKCTFEQKSVECCYDTNCPTGYYCTAQKTCSKSLVAKQSCPKECCIGEELYFDKACPSDKPNCNSGACSTEFVPSTTCKSCDEYALSKIVGGFWKSKQCKPAFLQNMLTCSFSFIKLAGVALVFLFGLLFGKGLFSSFDAIKDKEWLAWLLSIIVAGILAYLVFALFWLGIIVFIIFIIAQVVIKLFLPTKYLKALRR